MSEKELLYIDDVLGHISNMEDFLDEYSLALEDETYKNIILELSKLNKETYKKFYKMISK